MSGRAIRFKRFHDQPATAIVASKHKPLSNKTATPSSISVGRRKANQREASTRNTIGATTCHSFACTLFSVELPSNSHPERNACFCAKRRVRSASATAST